MGGGKEGYRGSAKESHWAVEFSFNTPILTRIEATQYWKLSSDTIFRGLFWAALQIFGERVVEELVRDEIMAISSMILLKDGKPFIPNCGMRAYVAIDESDAIDPSELVGTKFMLRVPRAEGFDAVPFEYNALFTVGHKWIIVGKSSAKSVDYILPSFRLLGEVGFGAKRSRGFGRFSITKVEHPSYYGLAISESGILVSRYLPQKDEEVVGESIYYEDIAVNLGAQTLTQRVIAEGSRLLKCDRGKIEFLKDSLGNYAPVLLRPLIIQPTTY
ncbi:MAG: hypothetical protein QXH03_09465 [Candidatus Bathyarchaeia archaeon]